MKIVLATGIYPPDIGGPATYVASLARRFAEAGHEVTVVTYGEAERGDARSDWAVRRVAKGGGPLALWRRYARVLQKEATHADVVEAFSSVSAGVPLLLARLRGPATVLRLGGDFLWERATDRGVRLGLEEWYARKPASLAVMRRLLTRFDEIAFSTAFQRDLYARFYRRLPPHGVIENAYPSSSPAPHAPHRPLRLLSLGRLVAFKNLSALVGALPLLSDAALTIVGEGPEERRLRRQVREFGVADRVTFRGPVGGAEKDRVFAEHDLMVAPSLTEISPNAALEARAAGLPVLLTRETGLAGRLVDGMTLAALRAPEEVAAAVRDAAEQYPRIAAAAARELPSRTWDHVASEHLALFHSLL